MNQLLNSLVGVHVRFFQGGVDIGVGVIAHDFFNRFNHLSLFLVVVGPHRPITAGSGLGHHHRSKGNDRFEYLAKRIAIRVSEIVAK